MVPVPLGGSSLCARGGGVRLLRKMGLRAASAQSTTAAALSLGEMSTAHIGRSSWGSVRQYCAHVASSRSVSPTVLSEGGNVTPNAIGPSIEINRNSLPSLDSREFPSDPIDASTSYPSKPSSANITKRSILTRIPVYTTHIKPPTPLSSHPYRPRTPHFVLPPLPTHAHVRSLHTTTADPADYPGLIQYNSRILYTAQGDSYRDLIIRNWPIQTANMSVPTKQQPGSPELAAPPSKFSLGGVKSSLDGLVRGNKPEGLNIQKQDSNQSEAELRKKSGIMSPQITINEKEEEFVGSVDQGTTSSRFIIFNAQGEPVASHQLEFNNIYPQSG